jgi:hypothetical protein
MNRMELELKHNDAEEAGIRCVIAVVGDTYTGSDGVYLQLKLVPSDDVIDATPDDFPDFEGAIPDKEFLAYVRMLTSFARSHGWTI